MLTLVRSIAASLLIAFLILGCVQPRRLNLPESPLRKVEQESIQKASNFAKQYAECVMLSTLVYQSSSVPASDVADVLQSKCQDKLDAYEIWMSTYYAATIDRGRIEAQSERARRAKEELRLTVRQQAIVSIVDYRMKNERKR